MVLYESIISKRSLTVIYCVADVDVRLSCRGRCYRHRLPSPRMSFCPVATALVFFSCRAIGLCVALRSRYRRILFASLVHFVRIAITCSYVRGREFVVRDRTGPSHHSFVLYDSIYYPRVCGLHSGRQVRTCTRCNRFSSRVIQGALLFVRRRSSTSSSHTRDILLFMFPMVVFTVVNFDISSNF